MNLDLDTLKEFENIVGCDEVGRGPIAGPVNACAVRINRIDGAIIESLKVLNITDSKKLSSKKRMQILEKLDIDLSKIELDQSYSNNSLGLNFSYCVSEHSHQEIDKMNILQASLSAMKNACGKIQDKKSKILVDGNKVFESSTAIESIIKGDSKVIAIALASIIAKEYRDKKMKEYDALYPGYNLSQHAGYPTKEHRDAVKKIGPSAIHRKSFKGVKEYL